MDCKIEIKEESDDDEYLANYESQARYQTIKLPPINCTCCSNKITYTKIKEEIVCNNTSHIDTDDTAECIPKAKKVKAGTHVCTICPMSFTRFMDLERHVFRHNGTRNYPCNICHVKFITTNDLNKHLQRHATDANFPCSQCADKKFKTIMSLKAHIKLCHYTEERVKHLCTECGSIFTTRSTLWMHKRRIHTDIRKFRCAICDKGFCKQGDLRYHMISHSDFREFKCDLCPAEYKKKNTLLTHRTVKHGIGNHGAIKKNNQPCSYCPERFYLREQLEFHIRREHTGVKPFECCLCERKFIRKAYVKDHLKRKHHLSAEEIATEIHFTSNDESILNQTPDNFKNLEIVHNTTKPEVVFKQECISS